MELYIANTYQIIAIESNVLNNGRIDYCNLSSSYIQDNYFRNGGMSSNSTK
jgi:hypothetical protein